MKARREWRKHALMSCIFATLALPAVALADQSASNPATAAATPAASASGKGLSKSETVERRATITAIDAATRTVTLKGEKGEYELEVSPEVPNFDRLKVGDVVVATYTQSIAARIAAPGEAAAPGISGTVKANPVDKGQASAAREVTASLKVEAVDTTANTVTFSAGTGRTQTVEVVNPQVQERLKTLKPGDVVVVTYTEALALKLEKVAK